MKCSLFSIASSLNLTVADASEIELFFVLSINLTVIIVFILKLADDMMLLSVFVVPRPSVSSLFSFPLLFYERADDFFRRVDETAEGRFHDEVDEPCAQREHTRNDWTNSTSSSSIKTKTLFIFHDKKHCLLSYVKYVHFHSSPASVTLKPQLIMHSKFSLTGASPHLPL